MAYKFNPFTGTLDYYQTGGGGSGVIGIPPTTPGAIARWVDTAGTTIGNSPNTLVQDSGAIEAQAFIFNRQILNNVTVPDNYTMINTDIELISGDVILLGSAVLLLL